MLIKTALRGGFFVFSQPGIFKFADESDIGNWLLINGECIYGTNTWIRCSNTEKINAENKKRDGFTYEEDKNKSLVSKPTQYYTTKGTDLYVIFTQWPENHKLEIGNLKLSKNSKISFLETKEIQVQLNPIFNLKLIA